MQILTRLRRAVNERRLILWKQHKCGNLYADKAIRKHGRENFIVEVLEKCETFEQLNEREKYWIAVLRCKVPFGYNRTEGGEGNVGYTPTPEHRANLRAANLGKKLSEEHVAKIKAATKGKKRTPEQCANISAGKIGHEVPEEVRAKLEAANLGKKASDETKFKMSIKGRGKTPYKNLVNEMDSRRLTYKALGEMLGLSKSSINRRMCGKKNFTASQIAKLVEIFQKPAEYLMAREDNQ